MRLREKCLKSRHVLKYLATTSFESDNLKIQIYKEILEKLAELGKAVLQNIKKTSNEVFFLVSKLWFFDSERKGKTLFPYICSLWKIWTQLKIKGYFLSMPMQ